LNPVVIMGTSQTAISSPVGTSSSSQSNSSCSTPGWYSAALQNAAAVQQHNWQTATNQQRDKVWAELEEWTASHLGKAAVQCTPGDLVVYLTSYWLGNHGRQILANGATAPAPSTLESTLSHLSTRFAELGRRGDWDLAAQKGNPCHSMQVKTFRGGYSNLMQDAGFLVRSVPPLPEWKHQQLVQHLQWEADMEEVLQVSPWHVEALLRRDAAIAELLWDSHCRPAEVGTLQHSAVQIGDGQVRGQAVSSKMCHAAHGARQPRPIVLEGAAGEKLEELLTVYFACLQRHHQPLGSYLFSPLQRDGRSLDLSRGLSSGAMTKRIVGHLQRLRLYEGESAYSLKRGSMQHAFWVEGQPLSVLGEAADIDTAAVVQMYVDPLRHL